MRARPWAGGPPARRPRRRVRARRHARAAAQDYLPPAVQDQFLAAVAEFVLLPWREAARGALADASQGGTQVAAARARPAVLSHVPVSLNLCRQGEGLWRARARTRAPALQPHPGILLAPAAALARCLCAPAPAPHAGHESECAGAPAEARPRPTGAARRAQAAADARSAAGAQAAWLRAQMGPRFSRRLLAVTREIMKKVGLHDGQPAHRFPVLAGSHLSKVRPPACGAGAPRRPGLRIAPSAHNQVTVVVEGHRAPLRCGPTSWGRARGRRSWARPRWRLCARCAR